MGERILREEGYEVVSVTDGDTALKRLADVDPDLIVVDVFLPGVNGFELCRKVKAQLPHRHVRVVMTAGMLEVFDEDEALRSGADAIIKKPFEATAVVDTIKPLVADARLARSGEAVPAAKSAAVAALVPSPKPESAPKPEPVKAAKIKLPPLRPELVVKAPPAAELDPELVRAAVTVALDEAMPALIDDITERVMAALRNNR
jgi:DNA-binding response OmpR family regulator